MGQRDGSTAPPCSVKATQNAYVGDPVALVISEPLEPLPAFVKAIGKVVRKQQKIVAPAGCRRNPLSPNRRMSSSARIRDPQDWSSP